MLRNGYVRCDLWKLLSFRMIARKLELCIALVIEVIQRRDRQCFVRALQVCRYVDVVVIQREKEQREVVSNGRGRLRKSRKCWKPGSFRYL